MFDWISGVIAQLGVAGVAVLTFLENLFPPLPSELIIPLAGFVAASGELNLAAVIAGATVGSLAGATFWYVVGRRIGEKRLRAWVDRHGRWITLGGPDVDRAEAWFRRHGGAAVFLGRLVPGVRTFISLPAGFTGMPLVPFLIYSLLGTLIWTAALAYAGVVLQAKFARVHDYLNVVTNVVLAVLGLLMLRRYVRCWTAGRRRNG